MLHNCIRYCISVTLLWWMGAVKSRYQFISSWCFLIMVTPRFVWNVDNTNIWIYTSLKRIYKLFDRKCRTAISQPTFQRRINVVSTLWINVEITLTRLWKWNKIRRRIFNVAQRWIHVETTLHNVETTLHNVVATLFQPSIDVSQSYIKSSRVNDYHGFAKTWIVFIRLNKKTFFYYILTIQLLMKHQKEISNSGTYRNTQRR